MAQQAAVRSPQKWPFGVAPRDAAWLVRECPRCNVGHIHAPQIQAASAFPVLPSNLGGSCPYISGPSKRVAMMRASSVAHHFSPDHHAGLFLTRLAAHVPTATPAPSADRPASGPQARVRTHTERGVVVLEVAGRLGDVVEDLDRAIRLALADGPRGVVCDLSAVLHFAEPVAVDVLATAGRHVRDWPGTPVAVACPDPRIREALAAHPLGGNLITTTSVFSAVSMVLVTPALVVEWLRLAPHPTAPRASRNFVTRTLLDWGLGPLIRSASLVVSELVTDSTFHAGTDIALSVTWSLGGLRLTVRDNRPELSCQLFSQFGPPGPGRSVVATLSRAYGVLPTAEGGKVVWAVLNAARPRPRHLVLAPTTQ